MSITQLKSYLVVKVQKLFTIKNGTLYLVCNYKSLLVLIMHLKKKLLHNRV